MHRSLAFGLFALAACGDDAPVNPKVDAPPPTPDADPYSTVVELPVTPNRDLDILFVVDDSPSMLDKQANLAANFPNFVNVLNTIPGGLPNLHIGVVTSDLGTRGSNGTAAPDIGSGPGGCTMTGGRQGALVTNGAVIGNFLVDIRDPSNGSRTYNHSGDLAGAFAQMARVGANGCGFEQTLGAMKAALGPNPANQGFLRANALLAVVFLTDEDDCSVTNPAMFGPESPALGPLQSFRCTRFGVKCAVGGDSDAAMNTVGDKDQCAPDPSSPYLDDVTGFRDFLLALKGGDRSRLILGAIMGPTEPFTVELRTPPGGGTAMNAIGHSCTYQGAMGAEVADPAVRIKALLDEFPSRSTTSTICQQDLSDPLQQIAQIAIRAVGTPCITSPLVDVDPATAGDQYDCMVEDVLGPDVTPLAACGPSPAPGDTCYRFVENPSACPLADNLELQVTRGAPADPLTVTRVRCRVE